MIKIIFGIAVLVVVQFEHEILNGHALLASIVADVETNVKDGAGEEFRENVKVLLGCKGALKEVLNAIGVRSSLNC